jgi:hypothetical protein
MEDKSQSWEEHMLPVQQQTNHLARDPANIGANGAAINAVEQPQRITSTTTVQVGAIKETVAGVGMAGVVCKLDASQHTHTHTRSTATTTTFPVPLIPDRMAENFPCIACGLSLDIYGDHYLT